MSKISYSKAVGKAIYEEMKKDERVFFIGLDIEAGYGGAFGVSKGWASEFPPNRVMNMPISEAGYFCTGGIYIWLCFQFFNKGGIKTLAGIHLGKSNHISTEIGRAHV